jgi:hypothetical protein
LATSIKVFPFDPGDKLVFKILSVEFLAALAGDSPPLEF